MMELTVVNDLPFLQLHSLALGRRSPQEWDVLAGDVEPVCMKEPFHVAAEQVAQRHTRGRYAQQRGCARTAIAGRGTAKVEMGIKIRIRGQGEAVHQRHQ